MPNFQIKQHATTCTYMRYSKNYLRNITYVCASVRTTPLLYIKIVYTRVALKI